jgi:methylglutaconyl-CoA hydratase
MELINYSVQHKIGYITLNRPEKKNALNFELVAELKSAFNKAKDDELVKVIVLKANGNSFCAGADLAYLQKLQSNSYEENLEDSNHLKELFFQIYTLKKVVIAQVQGHALAGGCGLAAVCDFAFAVPEANFGYTEVRIGFVPAIVMYFLLKKIGEGKAKSLLLSGEIINADQACQFGLIYKVVEANNLTENVTNFAMRLIENNSGKSMELTKQMISEIQSMPLQEALSYASKINAEARSTIDCKNGINAFINKTKPSWG